MSEREGALEGVLSGVRVLDFGRYIAGPYCAALLADLGADVIRIERIGGGEDRWVAPVGDDGVGAMYLVMNRNKRAMTLDPACPEGREIVRKLVATADVVVANLPPEVLRSLALDLESLRAVKPDIILTTVTAFGAGRPVEPQARLRRHRPGDGRRRVPDRHPRAAAARVGGLGRLRDRVGLRVRHAGGADGAREDRARPEGRGRAAAHRGRLQQPHAGRAAGRRARTGSPRVNRGQTSAPSDMFRTKDGWIIAYAIGGPMFTRWAKLMGEEHWLTDPRFKDDLARGDNGEVISKRMSEWTAERTTAEALAELEKAKVPAGPLYSPQQALEDAHIRAAGLLGRHRLSGAAAARAARAHAGRSLRDPGALPPPGAYARRAHRRDPRRAGLPRTGHRRPSRPRRGLTGGERCGRAARRGQALRLHGGAGRASTS